MMPRTAPAELKPESDSIVRWHDVAGVEEAKAELAEIIEFLRDPARFERLGARVPRGVLLHGPPGTGKTLLAKAVAAESGAAFFSQPASAFVEMFAGLGASRIRKLFDTARKHAPAIVFIDELDAVGAARQGPGGFNREQDQTLNQLLVELDGFRRSDVVIMASTNRLDTLDAALLRPGRFDRQVYVSPPDLLAREQILNVHVRNKPVDDSVDLTAIARATAGLTGADLENICNEAAIRATRAGRDAITPVDFDDALERVVAGLKTHRTVSEDEKRMIAYHESGHALLAHIVGRGMTIHKVTIVPRGAALGYNLYTPTDERILSTRDDLVTRIVVLLGGRAGEEIALGEVSNGAGDDLERATAIARAMVFDWGLGESLTTRTVRADNFALSEDTKRQRDQEQSAICDYAYGEAKRLLTENRDALERLAVKLLERETLDREDVATMLHDVQRVGTLAFSWPGGPLSPGIQP
jgi:cell division protease FtsH